jgi:hypothetical protein
VEIAEGRLAATGIKGGTLRISAMSYIVVTSSAARTRIRRAEAWLESRSPDEELLVIGATLDAANELVRRVAKRKGAAFGWHRLTLPQLTFTIAGARSSGARAYPSHPNWRGCPCRPPRTSDERGG